MYSSILRVTLDQKIREREKISDVCLWLLCTGTYMFIFTYRYPHILHIHKHTVTCTQHYTHSERGDKKRKKKKNITLFPRGDSGRGDHSLSAGDKSYNQHHRRGLELDPQLRGI